MTNFPTIPIFNNIFKKFRLHFWPKIFEKKNLKKPFKKCFFEKTIIFVKINYLGCAKIFINFYWFNFGRDREFRIRTWPNRIRLWSVIFCNLIPPPKFISIYFIQTQRRSTWYKHKNWPTHHFFKKFYFSINFYLLFKVIYYLSYLNRVRISITNALGFFTHFF